jgi:hypothetical protein
METLKKNDHNLSDQRVSLFGASHLGENNRAIEPCALWSVAEFEM